MSSPILEILLSLVFLYFVLSVVTSSSYEWLARSRNWRGGFLKKKLLAVFERDREEELFHPKGYFAKRRLKEHLSRDDSWPEKKKEVCIFLSEIYERVTAYSCVDRINKREQQQGNPDEIKALVFTEAVLDRLYDKYEVKEKDFSALSGKFLQLKNTLKGQEVEAVKATRFWKILESLISSSKQEEEFKEKLNLWYTDYTNLVTRRYARTIRRKLVLMGLLFAFILNIDSIHIVDTLWKKDELRKQLAAGVIQKNLPHPDSLSKPQGLHLFRQIDSSLKVLKESAYPIGWHPEEPTLKKDTALFYHFRFPKNYADSFITAAFLKNSQVEVQLEPRGIRDSSMTIKMAASSKVSKLFAKLREEDTGQYLELLKAMQEKQGRLINLSGLPLKDTAVIVQEHFPIHVLDSNDIFVKKGKLVSIEASLSSKKKKNPIASLIPEGNRNFTLQIHQPNKEIQVSDSIKLSINHISTAGLSIRLQLFRKKTASLTSWWDNLFKEIRNKVASPLAWLGWLITAVAVAMGAPFWFDLFRKITGTRNHSAKEPAT
jgi:hypothetical protein